METEAKIIIAFLFNRSGKTMLTEAELYLPLSMELGWFTANEAQDFIAFTVKQNLLVKDGKLLHPNFPIERVSIPVGFAPSKKRFEEHKPAHKEEPLLETIISNISKKTHRDASDIEKEIQQEAKEKNILLEIAALAVAWRNGVPITEWLDRTHSKLFTENTQ